MFLYNKTKAYLKKYIEKEDGSYSKYIDIK